MAPLTRSGRGAGAEGSFRFHPSSLIPPQARGQDRVSFAWPPPWPIAGPGPLALGRGQKSAGHPCLAPCPSEITGQAPGD